MHINTHTHTHTHTITNTHKHKATYAQHKHTLNTNITHIRSTYLQFLFDLIQLDLLTVPTANGAAKKNSENPYFPNTSKRTQNIT